MQPLIGRDAVLLLIDHRIGSLRNYQRVRGEGDTVINAQIAVLKSLREQLGYLVPFEIDPAVIIEMKA